MNAHLPRIEAIATCVPSYAVSQIEVATLAAQHFSSGASQSHRLRDISRNAQIDRRYICKPPQWYLEERSFSVRNKIAVEHSLGLLEEAALGCLERSNVPVETIGGLVVVSSTGLAVPTLDALLMERIPFRRDIRRLPVFGFACAGGVLGLARAASMAMAEPGLRVMLLVVEVCSFTFQPGDMSMKNVVASTLFGDGAAGIMLSCDGHGPVMTGWGEYTWPNSLDLSGWDFTDTGLDLVMSQRLPQFTRNEVVPVLMKFLEDEGLTINDIDVHVPHPGGAKMIAALEEALGQEEGSLTHSRAVLREYGNMSGATVLFVLDRTLAQDDRRGRFLLSGLGPGFTAAFGVLQRPA